MPFVLLDELGRLADQALERDDASEARGYVDALFYVASRAFVVGDWERYRHATSVGREADPDSSLMLSLGPGEATMRGDLESARSLAHAAVERARQGDNGGPLAFMLGLLAVVELSVDPVQALAYAEEAVDVARRSPATSALIYPLCMLSLVTQLSDPDRALAAAEECVRLDQTHRKAWSTVCEGSAAKLRVDRGEVATGLRLWRDVLQRLHWSGELGPFSLQLPALGDSIATIDPTLALELAAIAESDTIAPFPVFDNLGVSERLAHTIDELGPDALQAARSSAASMSYDAAVQYVFDAIDRLITETANNQHRAAAPDRVS